MDDMYYLMIIFAIIPIMYLVNIQAGKAIVAKSLRANTAKEIFGKLGFKNFHLKDFNTLDEKGLRAFILVIRELKQSQDPLSLLGNMGANKDMQTLQMLQSMGGQPQPIAQPQPQPQQPQVVKAQIKPEISKEDMQNLIAKAKQAIKEDEAKNE